MKTRTLAWDPDESTLAFHQQSKKQREKPDEDKVEADEARIGHDDKNKDWMIGITKQKPQGSPVHEWKMNPRTCRLAIKLTPKQHFPSQ